MKIEQVKNNPYITTKAIEDSNLFFGRQSELEDIINSRIKNTHPISTILIGGRKIGKTSLLKQIQYQLFQEPDYFGGIIVPVYISLQNLSPLSINTFFEQIAGLVCQSLERNRSISISLNRNLEGRPYEVFCKQVWEVLNRCSECIGSVRLVILIDELEELLKCNWKEDIFSNLRDLINTSNLKSYISLVLAGFRDFHESAMVEEKGIGSRLGNAAYWSKLSVLNKNDYRALISKPINVKIDKILVENIYNESGGHPFVTQYIMHNIIDKILKQKVIDITSDVVIDVREDFHNEIEVFSSWLEKFIVIDRKVFFVLACSKEQVAISLIQKQLKNEYSPGEVKDSLDFLSYTGVVAHQENKYETAGNLFKDWFLDRYKPKEPPKNDTLKKGFNFTRFLVSVFVVLFLFITTVGTLVWAAKQVHPIALAFILVVAIVFLLISVVTVLAMNNMLKQDGVIKFYNTVLSKIPVLKLSLPELPEEKAQDVVNPQDEDV